MGCAHNAGAVPCESAAGDSSISDASSKGMSVDSSCSSLYSPKENGITIHDEPIDQTLTTKREGIDELVNSSSEVLHQSSIQDLISTLLETTSTSLEVTAMKKYTTHEIEHCLAKTQKLFRILKECGNKCGESGNKIWNELKCQLKNLKARSSNPTRDVNPKYLHDVSRFRARVATSIQCHEAIIQVADEPPAKRRRMSVPDDFTILRSPLDVVPSAVSSVSPESQSDEVTSFLQGLEEEIYAAILADLCSDNMRGSFCRAPIACIEKGRTFACPKYAIHQKCTHEKDQVFSHAGYIHTVKGCTVHHRNECKARHPNGEKCRTKVVFFHIRASCMSLRGDEFSCRTTPCLFGHDNPAIRKAVMTKNQ